MAEPTDLKRTRQHIATLWSALGGPGYVLKCKCGQWEARGRHASRLREDHRAHRVEMGEWVKPRKEGPDWADVRAMAAPEMPHPTAEAADPELIARNDAVDVYSAAHSEYNPYVCVRTGCGHYMDLHATGCGVCDCPGVLRDAPETIRETAQERAGDAGTSSAGSGRGTGVAEASGTAEPSIAWRGDACEHKPEWRCSAHGECRGCECACFTYLPSLPVPEEGP